MNEESAPVDNTPAPDTSAPAPAAAPSLEDIASQFAAPAAPAPAYEPQQTPPAQSAPAVAPSMPDPVADPEKYAAWQAEQFTALNQQVSSYTQAFEQERAQRASEKEKGDIRAAVDTISADLDAANPMAVEGFLHYKYVHDPAFQRIWANRDSNPAAWNKALGVLSQEYKQSMTTVVDPQLAENQRALEQSYRGVNTGRAPANADRQRWAEMSDDDFDNEWDRMSGTQY